MGRQGRKGGRQCWCMRVIRNPGEEGSIRMRMRKTTLIPVFREFNTIDNFSLSVPVFTAAKQALQSNSTIISPHDS